MPCHPLEPNDCGMLGVGGICVPLSNDGTEQGTCENGFDTGTDGEDAVLHIDQTISANIFPLSDLDAFTVVLPPASGIYRIAIQPANGILDPRVDFYDAGELVAMADVNGPGQQEGYVVEIDTADSVDVLHFVVRTDGAASGPYTITFDQP